MRLVALTSWSALALVNANQFGGDGTTYGGNALGGTCGFQRPWKSWNTKSMGLTAALNSEQWIDSMNCGRCASVKHGDRAPVVVQIVDKCPECKHGDLDFASDAYAAIFQKGPGREAISWSFVDCPEPFVSGNLEFVLKEGSNEYWTAFQPQNFKRGIAKVELKRSDGAWEQLKRQEDRVVGFYFLYDQGLHGAFQLRVMSVDGQVIESPVYSSIWNEMNTEQQFGSGSAPQPDQTSPPAPVSTPALSSAQPAYQSISPSMAPTTQQVDIPVPSPAPSNTTTVAPSSTPINPHERC